MAASCPDELSNKIDGKISVTLEEVLNSMWITNPIAIVWKMLKKSHSVYMDIILRLLPHLSDINEASKAYENGKALLHYAVMCNNVDLVKALLENGADPNVQIEGNQKRPLHLLGNGDDDKVNKIITMLIDYGADIDAQDCGGNTPLHYCYCATKAHKFRLLIEYGASTTIMNKEGHTPKTLLYHIVTSYYIQEFWELYDAGQIESGTRQRGIKVSKSEQ